MMMFGVGGFLGFEQQIKAWVRKNTDVEFTDEQMKILSMGFVDYFINESLRRVTDDPELEFAIGEAFAPGRALAQHLKSWGEAAFDNKLISFMVGPGGQVISRFFQVGQNIEMISGTYVNDMSVGDKAQVVMESLASGVMASASDWLKIRMARAVGEWTTRHGKGLGPEYEAKFQELVAKGLLGLNPRKVTDKYFAENAMRKIEEDIRADARDTVNKAIRVTTTWGDGPESKQQLHAIIRASIAKLAVLDNPYEAGIYRDELYKAMNEIDSHGTSLFEKFADIAARGSAPDPLLSVLDSPMWTPEQKEVLKKFVADAMNDIEAMRERDITLLERNDELLERLP
jgi:hypothetical protein